jgi:hypothetical protein
VRDLQNARFIERFAQQLQTNGETMSVELSETARDTDSANAGQIGRDGEKVGKVHLQWVSNAFA